MGYDEEIALPLKTPKAKSSPNKITPKSRRTTAAQTRCKTVKSELDRMNRLLFQLSDQAIQHYDEVKATERKIADHVNVFAKRVGRVESSLNELKDNMETIQAQLNTHRDEVYSAKQTFKFDKRTFTEETDAKLKIVEDKVGKKIEELDEELKKLKKKSDSHESKVNQIISQSLQEKKTQITAETYSSVAQQPPANLPVARVPEDLHDKKQDVQPVGNHIYQSGVKTERDSRFKGFCCKIGSAAEASTFVEEVRKMTNGSDKPTHVMWAYQTGVQQDGDDDRELGASEKIIDVINRRGLTSVAVVVCRWKDGSHIGHVRWDLIQQCTTDCLQALSSPSYHNRSDASVVHDTLYIADSTGKNVDINRMIPGRLGERDTAYGLDTVERKLKSVSPNHKKVIIQTGINDVEKYANTVVEKKIVGVLQTAKEYLPRSEVYITSIIDRDNSPGVAEINKFLEAQANRFQVKYIDTTNVSGSADLFYDRKHPNRLGIGKIVNKIKDALGLSRNISMGSTQSNNYSDSGKRQIPPLLTPPKEMPPRRVEYMAASQPPQGPTSRPYPRRPSRSMPGPPPMVPSGSMLVHLQ